MDFRILIVEDEPKIRSILRDYFLSKQDIPTEAADGIAALELLEQQTFDAVLLDIMMPRLDGLSVCRATRKHSEVPIIFLTALADEEDQLVGYQLGADDYITKPFSLSVLYAKVTALIHRHRGDLRRGDCLTAGPFRLRLSTREVFVQDTPLLLTPKEYSLLECLLRHKGQVLSREQLLYKCWGYDYQGDARAVDTHIRRLREKLGDQAACIRTVIKAGYKLEV